jgi:hypothetical protein
MLTHQIGVTDENLQRNIANEDLTAPYDVVGKLPTES